MAEYYNIIKTCTGRLVFTLVDPMTNAKQTIEFASDSTNKLVPAQWAMTVFADTASGAYKLYKAGYFTFDKPEEIFNLAKEKGFLMGDIEMPSTSSTYMKDIKDLLLKGNITEINTFINASQKNADDLIRVARDNIDDLSQGIIKYIEKRFNTQLTVDGD